jgi:hypothetical protein
VGSSPNELRMRGLIFLLADSQSRAPRGAAAAAAAARARAPRRAPGGGAGRRRARRANRQLQRSWCQAVGEVRADHCCRHVGGWSQGECCRMPGGNPGLFQSLVDAALLAEASRC